MRSSNLIRWCMLAYAIVPVWFAVRACSKLGWGLPALLLAAAGRRGPPHHCPRPPLGRRGTCKIPTEAGDGVVLAYTIVPVWFTRFAGSRTLKTRADLNLTSAPPTEGGAGAVVGGTFAPTCLTLRGV